MSILLLTAESWAQQEKITSPEELKKLSIEELTNVEVTLVSRSPQKITEAASATQVITSEAIRRSGATNIPEALRLVPNLQVAQLNAQAWIISSRGFNTIFANKLLVMIDGRTVYTPLFGGVLWEMQHVLLEDVDRIEVVSGPGGTLWGANAVNGIINIVTKKTRETQGLYVSAMAGTFVRDDAAVRLGGKISDKVTYRVYGEHADRDNTTNAGGSRNNDAWQHTQGGFAVDWQPTENTSYTIQGDYYSGLRNTQIGDSRFNGQNILARWTKNFSAHSDFSVQFYYDRYFREDKPSKSFDRMNTWDLDLQYRVPISKSQNILTGVSYRRVKDFTVSNTPSVAILPQHKDLDLASGFIQDEISVSRKLKITLGTKVLHNVYTGIEFQPSGRIAMSMAKDNMLWAAVSRAVRTPSRFDVDYYLPTTPQPPTSPSVAGGPNFASEKVLAYELGYRMKPGYKASLSLAMFYNVYSDLYSVEALPGTLTYQIQNGSRGRSWGIELSGNYQVTSGWGVRGGYTFFEKDLEAKPMHVFNPDYLGNDAKHQVLLQSMADITSNLRFDLVGRYLTRLQKTLATEMVPAYFNLDSRLAWQAGKAKIAVIGQNLLKKYHKEFNTFNIPRSIYIKLTLKI